jgi:hypothetical protein
MQPACSPKASDLTQSEILSTAYSISENHTVDDGMSLDDLIQVRDEATEAIREIAELIQEKVDNMVDGFGHETSASDELAERGQLYEDWAGEVEGVDLDEQDEECDQCEGKGHLDVDCETCNGTGRFGDEQCSDCEGKKKARCEECDGTGKTEDYLDQLRNELEEAIGNCPE